MAISDQTCWRHARGACPIGQRAAELGPDDLTCTHVQVVDLEPLLHLAAFFATYFGTGERAPTRPPAPDRRLSQKLRPASCRSAVLVARRCCGRWVGRSSSIYSPPGMNPQPVGELTGAAVCRSSVWFSFPRGCLFRIDDKQIGILCCQCPTNDGAWRPVQSTDSDLSIGRILPSSHGKSLITIYQPFFRFLSHSPSHLEESPWPGQVEHSSDAGTASSSARRWLAAFVRLTRSTWLILCRAA